MALACRLEPQEAEPTAVLCNRLRPLVYRGHIYSVTHSTPGVVIMVQNAGNPTLRSGIRTFS